MTSHLRLWLLGVATLLSLGACDDECNFIEQTIVVPEPDPGLAALAEACRTATVAQAPQCETVTTSQYGESLKCACLPLCQRVLGLIDGFPGPETLKYCELHTQVPQRWRSNDAGLPINHNALSVSVTYRPANCNDQAQ